MADLNNQSSTPSPDSNLQDQAPQRQDPGGPTPDSGLIDISRVERNLDSTERLEKAFAEGDEATASREAERQMRREAQAEIATRLFGQDPLYNGVNGLNAGNSQKIQERVAGMRLVQRSNDLMGAAKVAGWTQLESRFREVIEEYRALNSEPLRKIRPHMDPLEAHQLTYQLTPIEIDPNKVAEMRQLATQIDQAMKQVDPNASFFEGGFQLPAFKEVAAWLNREAGPGSLGFMQAGPQQMDAGATGAQAAITGVEAMTDFGLNLLYGGYKLGADALNGMGVTDLPGPPTNYVRDPQTGELIPNTARPNPGATEIMAMMTAKATGKDVFDTLSALQNARDMESLQRSGMGEVVVGLSTVMGMIGAPGAKVAGGFTPAAKAMEIGMNAGQRAAVKGAAILGTKSKRMEKTLEIMGKGFGASVGNAAAFATAYGRMSDYSSEALHGAAITPVLLALGTMGQGTERLLRTRANMPRRVASAVGGAAEGLGFGVMEDVQTSGLWEFLKDPTNRNWDIYLRNVAGFALYKGAIPGPSALPLEVSREMETRAVERQAAELARTPETREQMSPEARRVAAQEAAGGPRIPEVREVEARRRGPAAGEREAVKEVTEGEAMLEAAAGRPVPRTMAKGPIGEIAEQQAYRREFRQAREQIKETEAFEAEVRRYLEQPEGIFGDLTKDPLPDRGTILVRDMSTKELQSEVSRIENILDKGKATEITGQGIGDVKLPSVEIEGKSYSPGALRGKLNDMKAELDYRASQAGAPEAIGGLPGATREGARPGVGSYQATPSVLGAVPKRALKPKGEVRMEDVFDAMEGRPAREGFNILGKRILSTPGDPIQMPIKKGRTSIGPFVPASDGVMKKMSGVIRLKHGKAITEATHEFSHAMMDSIARRNNTLKRGSDEHLLSYQTISQDFARESLGEARRLLVGEGEGKPLYAGADKWFEALTDPASKVDPDFALYKIGSEAFAEIGARIALGDAVRLSNEAPGLVKAFDRILTDPSNTRILEQFNRVQSTIRDWVDIGGPGRVRRSRDITKREARARRKKKEGTKIERMARSVKRQMFDDLADVRAAFKKELLKEGVDPAKVPVELNPAEVIDATRMTAQSHAKHFLMDYTFDPQFRRTGESFHDIMLSAKKTMGQENLMDYIVSVMSLEALKAGRKTTLPHSDYVATLRSLQKKYDMVEAKSLAKRMTHFGHRMIDHLQQAGGITKSDAQKMKGGGHFWITFLRNMDPVAAGGGRGVLEVTKGAKRKGGTEPIIDPVEGLMTSVEWYMKQAEKAKALQSILRVAKEGFGGFAEVVPQSAVPQTVKVGDVLKEAAKEAKPEERALIDPILEADLSNSAVTLFTQKMRPFGEKQIVAIADPVTGKDVWVELNPKLFEYVMGTNAYRLPEVLRSAANTVRLPADLMRATTTIYRPAFALKAAVRDIAIKSVLSRTGSAKYLGFVGGAYDFAAGAYAKLAYDLGLPAPRRLKEAARQFDLAGLELTNRAFSDFIESTRADKLPVSREKVLGIQKNTAKAIDKAQLALKTMLGYPGRLAESAIRVKEWADVFKEAKKQGATDEVALLRAQHAARDVTVNFTKGGVATRAIAPAIPYMKAGFVGYEKAYRSLNSVRGMAHAFANLTVPSLVIWSLFKDDEWYQSLPDWQRLYYWNLSYDGGETVVSVPKPFELGVMFGSVPEMFMEEFVREGENTVLTDPGMEAWFKAGQAALIPYIHDMSSVIPPMLKAGIQAETGYDLFREKPIIPEYIRKTKPAEEQVTPYTTQMAKDLFGAMPEILRGPVDNPAELENFLTTMAPGLTTDVFRTLDTLRGIQDQGIPGINPAEQFFRTGYRSDKAVQMVRERIEELRPKAKTGTSAERYLFKQLSRVKTRMNKLYDLDLPEAERNRKIHDQAMRGIRYIENFEARQ